MTTPLKAYAKRIHCCFTWGCTFGPRRGLFIWPTTKKSDFYAYPHLSSNAKHTQTHIHDKSPRNRPELFTSETKRNEKQTRAKSRFGFSDSLSFWFLAVDVLPHFPREGKALGFFFFSGRSDATKGGVGCMQISCTKASLFLFFIAICHLRIDCLCVWFFWKWEWISSSKLYWVMFFVE